MDFTLNKYAQLVKALKGAGYEFLTFEQYIKQQSHSDDSSPLPAKFVILRHDVDLKANNSLQTAIVEHSQGAKAVYYFRVIPESNQPEIIKEIASLGHEIGYHYEDMSICGGDTEKAYEHFKKQLEYFRTFYPVKTICMHGAPTSQYDGKDLWKKYNYKELGIIGEPYFDIDFSKMFYLTDTGRMWDGYKVSVRDKIEGHQERWNAAGLTYHTTDEVIKAINAGTLPQKLMITTHPQRWTDNKTQWLKEWALQTAKNLIKYCLIKLQ